MSYENIEKINAIMDRLKGSFEERLETARKIISEEEDWWFEV